MDEVGDLSYQDSLGSRDENKEGRKGGVDVGVSGETECSRGSRRNWKARDARAPAFCFIYTGTSSTSC